MEMSATDLFGKGKYSLRVVVPDDKQAVVLGYSDLCHWLQNFLSLFLMVSMT